MKSVTVKMKIYEDIEIACKMFAEQCNMFANSNPNHYTMCSASLFACPFNKECSEITKEDWKSIIKEI